MAKAGPASSRGSIRGQETGIQPDSPMRVAGSQEIEPSTAHHLRLHSVNVKPESRAKPSLRSTLAFCYEVWSLQAVPLPLC